MKASNASSASAFVSAIQISCSARLAFGCWLFGSLSRRSRSCAPSSAARAFSARPRRRPSRTRARHRRRRAAAHVEPAPLQIEQQIAPVVRALARAIGEADQFLLAFRRRADDDEDALRFVLQTRLQMDAVGPDVDVALGRQIALLPRAVLVDPTVLQPRDGGGRQPGSILAEQRRQRLGEVAGRDALQVEDRHQRLQALRAPRVGRQDRRREADALGIGGARLAVAHARLANGDRTDAGHDLALGQMAVAHDALVAVLGLQIGMLAEKVGDLGLDRLGEQGACPVAQDLGELVVERSLAESV